MTRIFPYQSIESVFPVVKKLLAAIEALPQRDWSPTVQEAISIVDAMGKEAGFTWLWTPEERAVASALKRVFSGPRTAHYGWRLYTRYRQGGGLIAADVTY